MSNHKKMRKEKRLGVEKVLDDREFDQRMRLANRRIDREMKKHEKPKAVLPFVVLAVFIALFAFSYYNSQQGITGLVIKEDSFVREFNATINESTSIPIEINGELTSFKISGALIGSGDVNVYLRYKGNRYLVLNKEAIEEKGIKSITGYVVDEEGNEVAEDAPAPGADDRTGEAEAEEESDKQINIALDYKKDSLFDSDDDGIEFVDGVVDFSVENTEFTWQADESKLCTRWETYSFENEVTTSVCYGNSVCCAFLGLESKKENWDDVFYSYYGRDGATQHNRVSARVVYIDYSLEPGNIYEDNHFSDYASLNEEFTLEHVNVISFSDVCVETCSLFGMEDELSIDIELNNASLNLTYAAYIAYVNESNVTVPEEYKELEQGKAVAGEPVKWTRIVKVNASGEATIEVPSEILDVSIARISGDNAKNISSDEIKVLRGEDKLTWQEYKDEKGFDKMVERVVELNDQISSITGNDADSIDKRASISEELTVLEAKLERMQEKKGISASPKEEENPILAVNATEGELLNVTYETEAPTITEQDISWSEKTVTISSDVHYENILAYAGVPEVPASAIRLYWRGENGDELVANVTYNDTNGNGLIDRIEWIVPHLSIETYVISITIINVQSYPYVGGKWTVMFNTTGTANLSINAYNGTTWSIDNETEDLKYLYTYCGNDSVSGTWINDSIFFTGWNCDNRTAYHTVKVLTEGNHTQRFVFGGITVYAYNLATVADVIINSTYGRNQSYENITVYYTMGDSTQKPIITWYKNGNPVNVLNMPFEGGSNSTWTKDYAWGINGTVNSTSNVTNADFETAGGGGATDAQNWSESIAADRASDIVMFGSWSMKVIRPTAPQMTKSAMIPLLPSTSYELSGWIYNNLSASCNAYLDLNDILEECSPQSTRQNGAWEFVRCNFTTSSTTTNTSVRLAIDGIGLATNKGNAWFDHIELRRRNWNATAGIDGKGAYNFDGIRDYINLGNDSRLSLTSGEFSISAWFKSYTSDYGSGGGDYPAIIARGTWEWFFGFHQTYIDTWTNNAQSLNASSPIVANQWYHVVWTHSTSANTWKLYINGQENASRAASAPDTIASGDVWVGGLLSGGDFFNGTIDDIRIYNFSLSAQQIQALYDNTTNRTVSQEIAAGDQWNACITPNDGASDGAAVCSVNLTVLDMVNPCTPPTVGDWAINVTCNFTNMGINIDGNLIITSTGWLNLTASNLSAKNVTVFSSGKLWLNNTNGNITITGNLNISGTMAVSNATISMNVSSDGQYGIYVFSGGTMVIERESNITHGSSDNRFGFIVNSGAVFNMSNSQLQKCGWSSTPTQEGLTINATSSDLNGNTFLLNQRSLVLYSSSNTVKSNIFLNNSGALSIMAGSNSNQLFNNSFQSANEKISVSANYNQIYNNSFSSSGPPAVALNAGSNYTYVYNNSFGGSGSTAINISSSNNEVYYNKIANLSNDAIVVTNGTTNNSVYLNTLNTVARGIVLQGNASYSKVYNNTLTIIGAASPAKSAIYIAVTGAPILEIPNNNRIYNNTINGPNNDVGISLVSGSGSSQVYGGNVFISNNIKSALTCIGITSFQSNYFYSNTLDNCSATGILFTSAVSDNWFIDSTITNSLKSNVNSSTGKVAASGRNYLLNVSLDPTKIGATNTSSYEIMWYLEANVTNTSGSGINGANVTVFNNSLQRTFNLSTGTLGFIERQNLTEFLLNSSGSWYYTNYTINVSKGGYDNQSIQLNLTTNVLLNVTLVNSNQAPTATSVNITSTDAFNRTNGTLMANWTFNDAEGHPQENNRTRWYRNSTEQEALRNLTDVGPGNLTRGDLWILGVSVYDGNSWSNWTNSSALTIQNSVPGVPVQSSPINNNDTVLDRTPFFSWSASTDTDAAEGVDNITYEINITRVACEGTPLSCTVSNVYVTGINWTNWTSDVELDTDATYNWSLRAYDGIAYSAWSAPYNFTILSTAIIFINGSINFGSVIPGETYNTSNDDPWPFAIENNGNVDVNVTVYANDPLWDSVNLNTTYFRFRIANYSHADPPLSELDAFDAQKSATSWTNITSYAILGISDFNYVDANDTADVEIEIAVPGEETAGTKNSMLVFTASYTS